MHYQPQPGNLLLLRACYDADPQAREAALREWERITDIEAHNAEAHGLLPMLKQRAELDGWTLQQQGRIAGLFRYWWARNTVSLQQLSSLVEALHSDAIDCIVLGDAALALGAYERSGLRPINHLELLVAPVKQPRAAYMLIKAGWKPCGWVTPRHALILESLDFENDQGQSITLRWYAADRCCWQGVDDRLWQRSRTVKWTAQEFRVPALADLMALTSTHPAHLWNELTPALWWADVLTAASNQQIDWSQVRDAARHYDRADPLNSLLGAVHEQFPGLVPAADTSVPPSDLWAREQATVLDGVPLSSRDDHLIRWQRIVNQPPRYKAPLWTLLYLARWYNLPSHRSIIRAIKKRL